MKILVTGSEGNVGKILVKYLLRCGHNVFRCDQVPLYQPDYTTINILSPGDLYRVFIEFRPEVVYHLAAVVSRVIGETSPGLTIDTNVSGTNNVIQACKLYNSRLVYSSTSEVYGNIRGTLYENSLCNPNNRYGLSKYLAEQIIHYERSQGLIALIVRPFMLYHETEKTGDNRSALIRFTDNLFHNRCIMVHKGSCRSWFHTDDAVTVLERLLYQDFNSIDTINIGNQDYINTADLAQMICDKLSLDYGEYVEEIPLPERMTLQKYPDLSKQYNIMSTYPCYTYPHYIGISEGIDRILERFKNEKNPGF